jgi:hypothetical protein
VVFWLSGAYKPLMESAYKIKFQMSKNSKENFFYMSGHSMFIQKFLGKRNILYIMCKKTKGCPANNHVGSSKFIFFTLDTKKMVPFPETLCEDIRISGCTCGYFFLNFETFWNVFSKVHMRNALILPSRWWKSATTRPTEQQVMIVCLHN